jgi:hypothetical protein
MIADRKLLFARPYVLSAVCVRNTSQAQILPFYAAGTELVLVHPDGGMGTLLFTLT